MGTNQSTEHTSGTGGSSAGMVSSLPGPGPAFPPTLTEEEAQRSAAAHQHLHYTRHHHTASGPTSSSVAGANAATAAAAGAPATRGGSVVAATTAAAAAAPMEMDQEDDMRPVVFRWPYGGEHVYVTGTFNNWAAKIPLTRSNEDFVAYVEIPKGAHQYKFIVDNEWRTDPTAPSAMDEHGNVNNWISDEGPHLLDKEVERPSSPSSDAEYDREEVEFEETRKNPPYLPPHLERTPLSYGYKKRMHDPLLLPVPDHVTLGHTYVCRYDDVVALGLTHRYESKYSTILLYKPAASTGALGMES